MRQTITENYCDACSKKIPDEQAPEKYAIMAVPFGKIEILYCFHARVPDYELCDPCARKLKAAIAAGNYRFE